MYQLQRVGRQDFIVVKNRALEANSGSISELRDILSDFGKFTFRSLAFLIYKVRMALPNSKDCQD